MIGGTDRAGRPCVFSVEVVRDCCGKFMFMARDKRLEKSFEKQTPFDSGVNFKRVQNSCHDSFNAKYSRFVAAPLRPAETVSSVELTHLAGAIGRLHNFWRFLTGAAEFEQIASFLDM